MTRPNPTTDGLTKAVQNANAELSEELANGEIERGFNDDHYDEDGNVVYEDEQEQETETETDGGEDDLTMVVRDHDQGGENEQVQTYTHEEWEAERGTPRRLWERFERHVRAGNEDIITVQVAHWFNDADVNKYADSRGRHQTVTAHLVSESDAAYKLRVDGEIGTQLSHENEFWVPKSAARLFQLK